MSAQHSKLILNNEELAQTFFEDTRLIGIMAPVKDFQFCLQLNQLAYKKFSLNPELEIHWKKKREYRFSVFDYVEPSRHLHHYLYNNKNDGEFLLPEFKHLDFLWLLKGDAAAAEPVEDLIQIVKNISAVQLVAELAPDKIKNKENLIL